MINTCNRLVCWNLNYVHAVDVTKLSLLRKRCTSHTALFIKFIKEVLEGDSCKCFALSLYLYMLLCLNCLMQTIGVASAWHDTSCKLIDNKNLIVLYNVILITEHHIVCFECHDHIMLNFKILRICKVINMEELLYLLNTLLG